MDSLILTFNKEQMITYKELLQKEDIELNFDTSLPDIGSYQTCILDEALRRIEKEAISLLNLNKHNSAFGAFLTQEEIKELIPIYYKSVREIKHHKINIGAESWKLSLKIGEINKILANINKRYADFLPYKAALYNREKYATKIVELDGQFKANIEKADNYKKELLAVFEKCEKLSNIVSDFFDKSSKASDEPKFKKFDAYDFFWALEAFIEQLKAIK